MNADNLKYLNLLLRRAWLIILAAVLAGGVSYFFRAQQPDNYRAQARLFIGNVEEPSVEDIRDINSLALTFVQFSSSFDLLDLTIEDLGLEIDTTTFSTKVSAANVEDTPILLISAFDTNPELAAAIANTHAQNLIDTIPQLSPEEQDQLERLGNQRNELEEVISTTTTESIAILEQLNQARDAGDEEQVAALTDQYNRLTDQLVASQATYAQISEIYVGLANRIVRLEFLERARPPTSPTGISPIFAAIFGIAAGGILALAAVLFFDYINSTIRSEDEIAGADLLGRISRATTSRKNALISHTKPDSRASEDFRSLLVNLIHRDEEQSFIVASAHDNEGRSFVAANLAVTMARNGIRVLLVDADLRNPNLHTFFDLQGSPGLYDLLKSYQDNPTTFEHGSTATFEELNVVQHYDGLPNLGIITSGLDNTGSTLGLENMEGLRRYLQSVREEHAYQIVLFDTSASLNIADGYNLAMRTDAEIILVVEAKTTSRYDVRKVQEQFKRVGNTVRGVVLNKLS